MRPCERWQIYLKILEKLWDGSSKISYDIFCEGLIKWRHRLQKHRQRELLKPSPATYTRIWKDFCTKQHLVRSDEKRLKSLLLKAMAEGVWDADKPIETIIPIAASYLSKNHLIPPAPTVLLRYLRATRTRNHRNQQRDRECLLGQAFNTALSAKQLKRSFRVARDILHYPPVGQGKIGIAKLEAEETIRREIEATLNASDLSISKLIKNPELDEAFDFVDRRATSTLHRWERREVLRSLTLYLAARHQQAIDAILFTFIRLVRLLRNRVQTRSDEQIQELHRALFERKASELVDLRHAVLSTLIDGNTNRLKIFRPLLRTLEKQSVTVQDRENYYLLLSSRGTFTRKIARRLTGMIFEGQDPHARIIVEILPELFRFAPFAEEVPLKIRRRLSFLDVPQIRFANRRIFETVVLITLADLIWLGRVTSPQSRRFRNYWADVTTDDKVPSINRMTNVIQAAKKELHHAWSMFGKVAKSKCVIINGRLVTRRLPRKCLLEVEQAFQQARQKFLADCHPISIVKVLMTVQNATGMLNAFHPRRGRGQRFSSDQRIRLALAVVLARGMNVGVTQMASLLGCWYTIGRLTNFDENYATIRNLEQANKILLDTWESSGLCRDWGFGTGLAADGRAILSSERTLLSGYHYRHRRTGVTLYWLVRDDWMAARVGIIGNYEWESWYLLDGMLSPIGGHQADWATGDTHGQHLALWGLSYLVGKNIRARFRRLSQVRLYHDGSVKSLPLRGVQQIRWKLIERALPSLNRLSGSVQSGRIRARDVLRTWNLYDEDGVNITEALRELGKAVRTSFILGYTIDEQIQQEIRDGCNRAETWNSFQEAVYWGHGGRMRTMDPRRREINALCMQLIMNGIVFYNALKFRKKLSRIKGSCPVMWEHIRLLGDYRITSSRHTVGNSGEK